MVNVKIKNGHRMENTVPQDFTGNEQKKIFYYEPREGGKDKDSGSFVAARSYFTKYVLV